MVAQHARWVLWIVVLGAAAGCNRDLDVVPPTNNATPTPAFLGDLSGYYEVEGIFPLVDWFNIYGGVPTGEVELIPLPITLDVLHLTDPSGSGEDPISFSFNGFDSTGAQGITVDGEVIAFTDNGTELNASELAGGGSIRISTGTRICPDSPRLEMLATRLCEFNPSLSGVYQGTRTSCDGTVTEDQFLALGFLDQQVIGMGFPDTSEILFGEYSRLANISCGFFFGITSSGGSPFRDYSFEISETEGQLVLDVNLADSTAAEIECPVTSGCESLQLARLSGGESQRCPQAFEFNELPVADGQVFMSGGMPYVSVAVYEDFELDPIDGFVVGPHLPFADVVIRRASDGTTIPQVDPTSLMNVPAETNAVYAFPAPTGAGTQYELFVSEADISGLRRYAYPDCVVYNGSSIAPLSSIP